MDRFDKFTDHARAVLTLAQDEAQRFRHPYIGTEHLLLGMLRVDDCLATRVLRNLGAEPSKVRTAVEFIIGRGDLPIVGEVGLTPRAKRAIELAIDEARRMDHHYIGTEHLLLGLVREGEGIAAGVLESLRVNLDTVRHEVIRLLAQSSSAEPGGRNVAPMTVVSAPIPVDEANRALEISRWYVDIGASPLRRVVGIGQVARDAGVLEGASRSGTPARRAPVRGERRCADRLRRAPGRLDQQRTRDEGGGSRGSRASWAGRHHAGRAHRLRCPAFPPDGQRGRPRNLAFRVCDPRLNHAAEPAAVRRRRRVRPELP
jgi:hypothetical protein